MADFTKAFSKMIRNEGGYALTNIGNDHGGQTYAGISRRAHPDWDGWKAIDRGQTPRTELVRDLYRERYWMPIRGEEIQNQSVAETIFDFAVNAGVKTASKLAQIVVGTEPDGVIGPITINAINKAGTESFLPRYTLAKIARYAEIVRRDQSQRKFLLGWVSRALRESV